MKNNYIVVLMNDKYKVLPKKEVIRMVLEKEITIDNVFFDLQLKEESKEAIERIEKVLTEEVLNGGIEKKESELLLGPEEQVVYLLQVLESLRGQFQGTINEQEKLVTMKKINRVSKKLYERTGKYNLV